MFLDDYQLPGSPGSRFLRANLGWVIEEISTAENSHHWAVLLTSTGQRPPIEVGVGVGLGLVALRYVKRGEPAAEPAAFHFGHVRDQAEQWHRGRFHGTAGQLPGIQPGALQLQRHRLAGQKLIQRRPLIPQRRPAFARVSGASFALARATARCCPARIIARWPASSPVLTRDNEDKVPSSSQPP